MVKFNIEKLKLRAAIQVYCKKHINESDSSIGKKFGVDHKYIKRWKNRTSFFNKSKQRKSKLT